MKAKSNFKLMFEGWVSVISKNNLFFLRCAFNDTVPFDGVYWQALDNKFCTI